MDTGSEARRILLVEDEKNIRDAVAAYLERAGYWVTPAADGQEAVDAFSLHQFDLVILDLMLPRLPGEKVCRIIRDTSDVPIIMLTAKGEVEDRIVGLELGAGRLPHQTLFATRARRARPRPAAPRPHRLRAPA